MKNSIICEALHAPGLPGKRKWEVELIFESKMWNCFLKMYTKLHDCISAFKCTVYCIRIYICIFPSPVKNVAGVKQVFDLDSQCDVANIHTMFHYDLPVDS